MKEGGSRFTAARTELKRTLFFHSMDHSEPTERRDSLSTPPVRVPLQPYTDLRSASSSSSSSPSSSPLSSSSHRKTLYQTALHICNTLIYPPSSLPVPGGLTTPLIHLTSKSSGLSYDAFLSLLKNVQTNHVKQTTGVVRSQLEEIFERYRGGRGIVEVQTCNERSEEYE